MVKDIKVKLKIKMTKLGKYLEVDNNIRRRHKEKIVLFRVIAK